MRRRLRALAPHTFQARLTVGFVGVVALTLLVVSALVLNRLDDYFTRQQQADLTARANNIANYVANVAVNEQRGLQPVVDANNVVDELVASELNSPAQQRILADLLGQADVTVHLGTRQNGTFVPSPNGAFGAELTAEPQKGQSREAISSDPLVLDVHAFYPFSVAVVLSNPYTFKATAVANVVGLLVIIGLAALALSMIVTAVLTGRFTTPLRRLTEASRGLAEGDLARRVPADQIGAGSSELTELAVQFNTMAERLEESVAIIRRDRDRSRDFLADVSHELRTPLAALRTFNELLKEQAAGDPEAREEFLDSSGQQIDRLDWLAQNLIELSKLDSGLVLLDLRPDDLRAAIESAVEQARPSADRRGLQLTVTMPNAPLRILHDPQRIGQVVSNLVGNSLKFTPRGGSVAVAVERHGDGARIEVTDTGVGIDASELPRIFERFYRGSRANEARGSGSGLGLSIVRSIVDMHAGTVTVESRLGLGSRFTVTLPRDPRAAEMEPSDGGESPDAVGPAAAEGDPGTALGAVIPGASAQNVADSSPAEPSRLNPEASP